MKLLVLGCKMLVQRSTTWLQRWSLSEPVGLSGEAFLVFLFCLDHILVSVQNMDVPALTEDSRCMLGVTLGPGSCSTGRNPEGAHYRESYCYVIFDHKTGDVIRPGRKRSSLCLCLLC